MGLNFVTISLHFFNQKKIQFFGPSRGYPFPLFFFPPLSFHFLGSCSSFLSLSFSSFFLKMIFFIISFLVFVSGFNKRCFLRSRCSMEMWCLDNIERDSWDSVGPPTGRGCHRNIPELRVVACHWAVCRVSDPLSGSSGRQGSHMPTPRACSISNATSQSVGARLA